MSVADFTGLQPPTRPQVERQRKIRVALLGWVTHGTGGVTDGEESRQAPAFRLVRVYPKSFEVPPASMSDVVHAPTPPELGPRVQNVEHARRRHWYRRRHADH